MDQQRIKELFCGFGCVVATVEEWHNFHRHDEIQFGFYLDGPVDYQLGGQVYKIMADECVLFWGAIPHLLRSSPQNNRQYWVTIPLEVFVRWGLPEDFMHQILNGQLLKADHKRLRELDIMRLEIWEEDFAEGEEKYLEVIMLAMESRIRRFGLESEVGQTESSAVTLQDRGLFTKVYDYIAKNFYDDIKVTDIAEHVGMHPKYVMTAFKKSCGQSIGKVITMMRIYEAQRLLTTTDMSVIDIALESGFGSLSNFYNCFKKHCGKPPNKYRLED
jgi:AraC family transcriptional regulator, melibiose operon regulatory protein